MKYSSKNTFSVRTAIYEKKIFKLTPNKLRWIVAVAPAGVTGKKKKKKR
jgi:hypothetical protein